MRLPEGMRITSEEVKEGTYILNIEISKEFRRKTFIEAVYELYGIADGSNYWDGDIARYLEGLDFF